MVTNERPPSGDPDRGQASDEERVYGVHASLAVFQHRRQDIRRVYVDEARLPDVKPLLRWCAQNSIAYHVVGPESLQKVTRSTHHEGLCLLARKPASPRLADVVSELAAAEGPVRVLLLENVRDPHNVGAVLRTAAHFGVRAVLLAGESARRSSALLRTAEGGAETTALVSVDDPLAAANALREAGLTLVATSSHARRALDDEALPPKVCVLLGAEREGLSKPLSARAQAHVRIDGTGAVESLNVAAATAVILADLWRRRDERSPKLPRASTKTKPVSEAAPRTPAPRPSPGPKGSPAKRRPSPRRGQ